MTDGTRTGTEQSDLKAQWDEMVSEALAERDAIMQAMDGIVLPPNNNPPPAVVSEQK